MTTTRPSTATQEPPAAPRPWYRDRRVLVCALVLGIIATLAWSIWAFAASPRAFVDLNTYRLGVQAWWHGEDMYGALPPTHAGFPLPYIYPPFSAIVFSPIVALPWIPSALAMMLISLVSLVTVTYLSVRRAWPSARQESAIVLSSVLVPLALLTQPVRCTIWFGQVNLLLLGLVALDCLVERPRWPRGVLVGIAAAIKLTPAIFLLYFLIRKDYRAAAWSVVAAAVATGIGFAANWSGSLTFWFGSSPGISAQSGSPFYSNQSIWSLLHRLGLAGDAHTVGWLAVLAVLLAVTVVGIRHAGPSPLLAMAVTGAYGLLVSPTSWGHHWVYCVPGIIAIAARAWPGNRDHGRLAGWRVSAVLAAVVYGTAPFLLAPIGDGPPYHWGPLNQVLGNSFTLTCILLLLALAWPTRLTHLTRL